MMNSKNLPTFESERYWAPFPNTRTDVAILAGLLVTLGGIVAATVAGVKRVTR